MYENMNLSAADRNYRKPGHKLRPRCGYDAMEKEHAKLHSMRALRRDRAVQGKAETEWFVKHEGFDPRIDPHWKKHHKTMDALSTRSRKRVERLLYDTDGRLEDMHTLPGRAMQRAYVSAIEAHGIDMCIEADQRMLRNAY